MEAAQHLHPGACHADVVRCLHALMQVLTEYSDEQLPFVLDATDKLDAHLTSGRRVQRPAVHAEGTMPVSAMTSPQCLACKGTRVLLHA